MFFVSHKAIFRKSQLKPCTNTVKQKDERVSFVHSNSTQWRNKEGNGGTCPQWHSLGATIRHFCLIFCFSKMHESNANKNLLEPFQINYPLFSQGQQLSTDTIIFYE